MFETQVFKGAVLELNTKERVLRAACTLFATRGFYNTTVREIAARAQTNLAAINYHFRSKDELYREVLSHSFREVVYTEHANPPEEGENSAGEERLRAFIRNLVAGHGDKSRFSEHLRLLAWEMLSPTSALDHLEEIEARRYLDRAKDVLRPLLPEDAAEEKLAATALALIGQCLIFRGLPARMRPVLASSLALGEEDGLTDLICSLFLQGLGKTPHC